MSITHIDEKVIIQEQILFYINILILIKNEYNCYIKVKLYIKLWNNSYEILKNVELLRII